MLDFREYKRTHDAVADVLPWAAMIAADVVLNKDGSFQATSFWYRATMNSLTGAIIYLIAQLIFAASVLRWPY